MGYFVPTKNDYFTKITVANNEMRTVFLDYLITYCKRLYNFSDSELSKAADSFKNIILGNIDNENFTNKKRDFTQSFDELFAKVDVKVINEQAIHDVLFIICTKVHDFTMRGYDIIFRK